MTSEHPFAPLYSASPRPRARPRVRVSKAAMRWFVTAFCVRILATLLIHLYSIHAGYGGLYPLASGADDITYWNLSQDIYNGVPIAYVSNSYPFVLAAFFHFTGGPNLLVGQLLNAVVGAVSVGIGVLIVEELARNQPSRKVRRRALAWSGALLTFYPSLLWYSTQLVKDPILVMLGMAALYFQICFLRRANPQWIAGWLLATGGLYFFRPYAAIALALSLFFFVVRFNRRWLIPSLILVGVVPLGLGMGPFGWRYIAPLLDTSNISAFREQQYSVGGSSAGITINYSNPLTFLATYSYSFATAMFGPFPWQISAAGQIIALPEAIGMWLLSPLWVGALRDLWRQRKNRDRDGHRDLLLMLFSLVLVGSVALFSDNIGANTRLRLLPWSAFLLLASLRLANKRFRFNLRF